MKNEIITEKKSRQFFDETQVLEQVLNDFHNMTNKDKNLENIHFSQHPKQLIEVQTAETTTSSVKIPK